MKLRFKSATLNPLDFIDKNSPLAIDDCNDLAKAFVVRTGEEKGDGIHFLDGAEAWIAAMAATVVQYGQQAKGTRSLQTVREMLSHPQKMDMAVKLMCESDAWGGMLARMGGQLLHFKEKELASTMTTTNRFLRFLDTPAIAANTTASSFDLAELGRRGRRKMTVYLSLPPEHLRAQSPLLRMWIGSSLRAVVRGGLQEKNKTYFALDEAASLGRLESLEDAVDKFRGYGVRLQFYYQSLGQLKLCWPEGQDQTLLSNTTQVFFGVNDQQTAEYVSARLGEQTIIVDSGGSGTGSSSQHSSGASQSNASSGHSRNNNRNWQQNARKLLKPEEVMALPARTAVTFTPGVPPVWTTLVRYFEEKSLCKRRGWLRGIWEACQTFVAACFFLFLAAACAALFTVVTVDKLRQDEKAAASQNLHP